MMKKTFLTLCVVVPLIFSAGIALADGLIFFHSPDCGYCKQWREDIGGTYSNTDEGKRLPLREVNAHGTLPKDLKHILPAPFTPTFVVIDDDNQEVGRILGYNPEFFWNFLDALIVKLDEGKIIKPKT
jgi:thioredoxin-related protein